MGRSSGFPRVVVVTGASAGVGRTTVRAFAKRGSSIGLLARGTEGPWARSHSPHLWVTTHRRRILTAVFVAAAATLVRRRRAS